MNILKISLFFYWLLPTQNLWAYEAYLNTEGNTVVSVYNMAGENWKTCPQKKDCKSDGWLPPNAKIDVKGSKFSEVRNPYNDQLEIEEFYEIDYEYTPEGFTYTKRGSGWVNASYFTKKKLAPLYAPAEPEKPKDCPPSKKKKPNSEIADIQTAVAPTANIVKKLAVTETAEALSHAVGQCALKPPDNLPPERVSSWAEMNSYDAAALPLVKSAPLPKVLNENGKPMTRAQLIEIDALARTLYAELANCFKSGREYPMAVAKVALNRKRFIAENPKRKVIFINGPHDPATGPIAQLLTTNKQFQVWDKGPASEGKKSPLRLALCPPQNLKFPFWTGAKPPKEEVSIWKDAMKIATETVLFPDQFSQRTKEVKQVFYTSAAGKFYGKTQGNPSIEGRQIVKNSCVELWNGEP